jgi:hypothetical protein
MGLITHSLLSHSSRTHSFLRLLRGSRYQDGKLSFDQFLSIVHEVEKERRVSKTGRPQKEVLAMYQQAMVQSGGKSNKVITIDGFLTVARQHNLGVPTPTSDSLFLSTKVHYIFE